VAFDSRLLDGLGVLASVVEAGSFVRAGEALGLTQPAVSRAVARLEDRIGVRLFHRTARSIALTDEGRRFYASVGPHLAAIQDATIEAGASKAKARGRLRVNTDNVFGRFALAPRLEQFFELHPDLFVELIVRDRMGDLLAEGFDVAVRFGVPEPSALTARVLMKTRVLTCASPSYVARHGQPKQPRDIEKGHECILIRDPTTGSHFAWEFVRGKKVVSVNATGRLLVNDGGVLVSACVGGHGIAQILELCAREPIADGTLVQLLPDWADETFPLYAYHHSPQLISAKVRAFLDFVATLTSPPADVGRSAGR
jgi:DNA-binding transcriptional LysR family regulator